MSLSSVGDCWRSKSPPLHTPLGRCWRTSSCQKVIRAQLDITLGLHSEKPAPLLDPDPYPDPDPEPSADLVPDPDSVPVPAPPQRQAKMEKAYKIAHAKL